MFLIIVTLVCNIGPLTICFKIDECVSLKRWVSWFTSSLYLDRKLRYTRERSTRLNIRPTSSSLKNFTGRAVLFSYLLLHDTVSQWNGPYWLLLRLSFVQCLMRRKSEVSFWELTRVALLESCPSLLEYTRGSRPPHPRSRGCGRLEAIDVTSRLAATKHLCRIAAIKEF